MEAVFTQTWAGPRGHGGRGGGEEPLRAKRPERARAALCSQHSWVVWDAFLKQKLQRNILTKKCYITWFDIS